MTVCIAIGTTTVLTGAYRIQHSGGFYNPPTYIKCSSSFSQATLTAVHNACAAWNSACNNGPLVYRNTATHNNTQYPLQNGVNEITKGDRSPLRYLMETNFVLHDTVYIYEADIDINTYFDFGTASTSYDTQSAMLHELGHLLGLDHSPVTSACMFESLNPGVVRGLHSDDITAINVIY